MNQEDLSRSLCPLLMSFGVAAKKVVYYGSNNISIYVDTVYEVEKSKDICISKFEEIVKVVLPAIELNTKNSRIVPSEWTYHCINNIYSLEERSITELVYEKKSSIILLLNKSLEREYIPKYVFSHSSNDNVASPAGYNIVFHTEEILFHSKENGVQNIINELIRKNLEKYDIFKNERFSVSFHHAKCEYLYGLARED